MKNELNTNSSLSRRYFLKLTGITTMGLPFVELKNFKEKNICLVVEQNDSIANMPAAKWATGELEKSFIARGVKIKKYQRLNDIKEDALCIVIVGSQTALARQLLKSGNVAIPENSEALGLVPVKYSGKQILLASGYDVRGLVYAQLELADRLQFGVQPLEAINIQKPIIEKPANEVRSLNRLFVSEVEDKPWFNDREMWPPYLTMLATHRYNRFNLSFGIGYDFLRNVTDAYFLFAYPFLLSVPGHNVKVPQLPDAERDNNLRMLKFISEETVAKGIEFYLGLWMHGYEWINSPNPNYTIQGISSENHAAYCRDAVRMLLQECPAISGITFRIHGESGVNEGSYNFWKTVFDGVKTCGRKVEIDMHSKGMDQPMIDAAVATGLPITISPKYWAEHMGMPYHQADIRQLEVPKDDKKTSALMNLSEGSRSFTRYGYGDLLKENRPYKIVYRIWPGTQRLLLWGDPLTAAAHSKAFSFCGTNGVELMEPLSFKGRRGSGIAGDRCGYADTSIKPRWDWEKYAYTLRVFGRMLFNPKTDADVWRRHFNKNLGPVSKSLEAALANSTRILPIILTSHGTSAGNNTYWPEIYTNHPLVETNQPHPYTDSPAPRVFGNVSPMDPQLFISINDYADELLKNNFNGKYTPAEVAQWLDTYANLASAHLKKAEAYPDVASNKEYKRMVNDIKIVIGLGRFFSAKFRAGILYAVYNKTGDSSALHEAIKNYRQARGYWARLSEDAGKIYQRDITVGERAHLRGHWLDRLPEIDKDIELLTQKLAKEQSPTAAISKTTNNVILALKKSNRINPVIEHISPGSFKPGQPLDVVLNTKSPVTSGRLHYRHVNHGERFEATDLKVENGLMKATIPAAYTDSPYPLQYYFELRQSPVKACLYPGFDADLANQPYFILRQFQA